MEWISVEDRLPFDDAPSDWQGCLCGDFLVVIQSDDKNDGDNRRGQSVTVYEFHGCAWHYFGGSQTPYQKNVTHWMPLPSPPK